MPGKLRNCPCCTERLTKDPVSWPGQSRIFSQEEKVEVVKYIGRTSPVPGRWPEHAEGLKARFGQTGLVWEKICSSCYTRVSGALTGYLQEKFEAAARTGGRHDRQQVRAFSATVKEQEENRKRKQQEKQQQQQQQQYGQAEGGVEGRARVTRAASRAAAVAVAAAAAAEAAAAGAVSPAAAAAAATMLAVALGGDATGDVQMVEAAARGSPNNSSTPTRHHTQPQGLGGPSPPSSAHRLFPPSPSGTTQPKATTAATPGGGCAPKRAKVALGQAEAAEAAAAQAAAAAPCPQRQPFSSMGEEQLRDIARKNSKEKKGHPFAGADGGLAAAAGADVVRGAGLPPARAP